jgi:hypothetical protein
METYPVDIDPGQLIHWLKAECDISPLAFRISARRTSVPQNIPLRRETHLGDVEREDLSEVETIATLDVAPAHASEGWVLSIVVEDEAGPRLLSEAPGGENEQTIDLGTFAKEFIRPGRGIASVTAEVQDAAARACVTKLINAIETNRHSGFHGGSKADSYRDHSGHGN